MKKSRNQFQIFLFFCFFIYEFYDRKRRKKLILEKSQISFFICHSDFYNDLVVYFFFERAKKAPFSYHIIIKKQYKAFHKKGENPTSEISHKSIEIHSKTKNIF